jgi:TonB family protein
MRREIPSSLVFVLCLCCGSAQQAAMSASASAARDASPPLTIHYAGQGVTAPELIPLNLKITPPQHCQKIDGTVTLVAVVDSLGRLRDAFFLRPLGTELDRLALNVVAADRFKPGAVDGAPAAVAVSDEVKLQSCLVERPDALGRKSYSLDLRSVPEQRLGIQTVPVEEPKTDLHLSLPPDAATPPQGVYRVGGNVTPPKPLNRVAASYSDKGRAQGINGTCLITMIVDKHGMPEDIGVRKSLEPSMDEQAIAAASQYRFQPAMRDGEPVAVMINVEVKFRLGSNSVPW